MTLLQPWEEKLDWLAQQLHTAIAGLTKEGRDVLAKILRAKFNTPGSPEVSISTLEGSIGDKEAIGFVDKLTGDAKSLLSRLLYSNTGEAIADETRIACWLPLPWIPS